MPEAFANAEVLGRDGAALRLGDLWAEQPAVLVFLRHFACIACTEHIALLAPRMRDLEGLGVRVVFVGNGTPNFIEGFIERNGLSTQVDVVTDPTLKVFRLAGMERSRASTYGPRALFNAGRAMVSGFRQTRIEGDALQQGGAIVIAREGRVVYLHRDRALGDHAPSTAIVDAAASVANRRPATPGAS